MNIKIIVVAFAFANLCGFVYGEIAIEPANRIVDRKIYNPKKSPLWMDITTNIVKHCSKIQVTAVGKTSIGCDVYEELLDDGGTYGVYRVIGEKYIKHILIFNHAAQSEMTTGALIYEGRFKPRGNTPTTKPFLSMRIANWRTNDNAYEAYDCGISDTIENRQKFGIHIPTPKEISDAQKKISSESKIDR